jgi:hypothetical protein
VYRDGFFISQIEYIFSFLSNSRIRNHNIDRSICGTNLRITTSHLRFKILTQKLFNWFLTCLFVNIRNLFEFCYIQRKRKRLPSWTTQLRSFRSRTNKESNIWFQNSKYHVFE